LRAQGYRVVGTDRRPTSTTCDAFVELDLIAALADTRSLDAASERLRLAIGGDRLDLLVNNAGVQILGHVEEVTLADWKETFAVNLMAPFFLSQAFLSELQAARGTVVNVASVHAKATKPKFVCYATSKTALVGLSRAMAIDLGPRVRVLAVNPAAVDTEMLRAGFEGRLDSFASLAGLHPLGRIAQPTEIARVIAFLASEEASFLTGHAVNVDGGILCCLPDPD
jgi:NAD(P)-dependent dehydrogenase (short-subunit alcohol dehydrogenase family)